MRWVAELADYNFSINYKPGVANVDADYLSRRPTKIDELKKLCTEVVDLQTTAAVVSGVSNLVPVLSGAVAAKLVLEPDAGVAKRRCDRTGISCRVGWESSGKKGVDAVKSRVESIDEKFQ